jgi:hypothetical protein
LFPAVRKAFSRAVQEARELIHFLLRKFQFASVDKKTIDRIVVQIKTLPAGKVINFTAGKIYLTKRSARFIKN